MHSHPFQLPPRARLHGHRHAAVHVCVVGEGGFVERDGARWRECPEGTVRISAAGASHRLEVESTGASGRIVELRRGIERGLPRAIDRSRFVSWPRALPTWPGDLDAVETEGRTLELIARTLRPDPEASPPGWLRQLRAELDLDTSHSLATVAHRIGRHRSHVARSFREWYGRSIGEHLRACRAIEAARRLRATDQPVVDLAHDLGFTDQAHLTRVFRSFYGMPPARFRRQAG